MCDHDKIYPEFCGGAEKIGLRKNSPGKGKFRKKGIIASYIKEYNDAGGDYACHDGRRYAGRQYCSGTGI